MSKKRTFKELLQLLPQKEQPEDKAEKEAAEHAPQESAAEARTADSAAEENAEESFEDAADTNAERLPLPLAGGLAQAPEADYETMSAEQFRTLRKQLKRAAMDGRRIRL